MQLARHENLCCLKLWPEVPRDDRWVHDRLYIVNIEGSNRVKWYTHRTLSLDVLVYSLRIRHIFKHNLANLQWSFSKTNLEDLQIPTLSTIES